MGSVSAAMAAATTHVNKAGRPTFFTIGVLPWKSREWARPSRIAADLMETKARSYRANPGLDRVHNPKLTKMSNFLDNRIRFKAVPEAINVPSSKTGAEHGRNCGQTAKNIA
jgi:hypothetical protein